jgi:hypothetical protein
MSSPATDKAGGPAAVLPRPGPYLHPDWLPYLPAGWLAEWAALCREREAVAAEVAEFLDSLQGVAGGR